MKKSTEDSESLTEDTEEDGKEALNTPNHDDVDNNIKNGKPLGRLKHKCLNIRILVFLYVYNKTIFSSTVFE